MHPLSDFHNPQYLWLLLALPGVALWASWRAKRRPTLRFSNVVGFSPQTRGFRSHMLWLLPVLQIFGAAAIIVALARPQLRDSRSKDTSVEGIDIMLAFDVSTSMEAGDFKPNNRLFVAKEVLNDFISSRTNDRIGLVVFSGAAYTQSPLTLDYGVLKDVVAQLKTRVLEDGTAIGDALATSLNRLRESDAKSRVIILMTDGDNNAGTISPRDAASMAKTLKIPVYTILVGKGGRVPFPAGQDLFGNPVWREVEIPINPELLQEISATTGGEYYRATDRESLRQGLQKVLDSLERSKLVEGGASATYREDFHSWLLLGVLFLAMDQILRHTALRVFP